MAKYLLLKQIAVPQLKIMSKEDLARRLAAAWPQRRVHEVPTALKSRSATTTPVSSPVKLPTKSKSAPATPVKFEKEPSLEDAKKIVLALRDQVEKLPKFKEKGFRAKTIFTVEIHSDKRITVEPSKGLGVKRRPEPVSLVVDPRLRNRLDPDAKAKQGATDTRDVGEAKKDKAVKAKLTFREVRAKYDGIKQPEGALKVTRPVVLKSGHSRSGRPREVCTVIFNGIYMCLSSSSCSETTRQLVQKAITTFNQPIAAF